MPLLQMNHLAILFHHYYNIEVKDFMDMYAHKHVIKIEHIFFE